MSPAFRLSFARAALVAGGLMYLLTGAAMLFAPTWFYENIGTFPPFNRHYTGDLGAFQLPLGVALLWAARRPGENRIVIVFAAAGSLLHALNHLADDLAARATLADMLSATLPLLVFAGVLILAYFAIPKAQVVLTPQRGYR